MARAVEILLFNKPYGMLSEQRGEPGQPCLGDLPALRGWEAAGRLDFASEGLLVLAGDGPLLHQITHPRFKLPRIYWAQVEGQPDAAALQSLRDGVVLRDGVARALHVAEIAPPALWPRTPPVQVEPGRTRWLALTLAEGRKRQVRRMTAAVGLPTLRLVRVALGPWVLGDLAPGAWQPASTAPG